MQNITPSCKLWITLSCKNLSLISELDLHVDIFFLLVFTIIVRTHLYYMDGFENKFIYKMFIITHLLLWPAHKVHTSLTERHNYAK